MAEVAEQQRHEQRLSPGRIEQGDHARQVWAVIVEAGTDPEELERPAYWSLVANKPLRPRAKLEVWWEDGTRYAEYVVHSSDSRSWAKVRKVLDVSFASVDVAQTQAEMAAFADYEVKWRSMHHKWSVVRKSDKQVVRDQMDTKEEAEAWLLGYLRTVA